MPVPYCLDDYSFVIQLEVEDCDASCCGVIDSKSKVLLASKRADTGLK